MKNEHTSREWQRIREIANDYELKGYHVAYPSTKHDIPSFLRDEEYIPDLVITSADENFIVEVKTSESVRHDKHISRVSEIVNSHANWQFLFVLTNPKTDGAYTSQPHGERWSDLLEQSRTMFVAVPAMPEATFVLLWAALEGVLRVAVASEATESDRKTSVSMINPRSMIRDAVILGLLDRKDISKLEELFVMRSKIVHAIDGPRPTKSDINFLLRIVDELARVVHEGGG